MDYLKTAWESTKMLFVTVLLTVVVLVIIYAIIKLFGIYGVIGLFVVGFVVLFIWDIVQETKRRRGYIY